MSQDDAGVLTPTIAAREAWMASRHLHSYLNTDQGAQFTRDGFTDWTVERIRREAASIGPATAALCELILEHRPHPEQGFRACSASCGWCGHSAPIASKPPPRGRSRSAR